MNNIQPAHLVWTEEDVLAGECTREVLNEYKPSKLDPLSKSDSWALSDFFDGRCTKAQVGQSKKGIDAAGEELALATEQLRLTPKQLRKDVLEAYKQLGGVKYLMRNPLLLEKLLVKVVAEEKPVVQVTNTVVLPSWAGPERLSYRENIIDAAEAFEANKQITDKLKD